MITVFGSINIDQVYHMQCLPKPGETLLGSGYVQVPGGKGANQALAARRAGAEVRMVGCVGADANADLALALMANDGVDLEAVSKVGPPTGCASIWVDGDGENSIVVYSGANAGVRAAQVTGTMLETTDFLLLQMEVPAAENWKLVARAKAAGVTTLLNLAPVSDVPESALLDLDYLVVNEGEASALATQYNLGAMSEEVLAQTLAEKFDLCCVLTLGSRGVIAFQGIHLIKVSALSVSAVDTTAAGDSFIGGFATSICEGETLEKALEFATVFAGLTCTVLGAQNSIPYREAIITNLPNRV